MELVRDLREEEDIITKKDNLFNGRMSMVFMIVCFIGMIYFTIDAKNYIQYFPIGTIDVIKKASLVLFLDGDSKTTMLKNRYGK